MKKKIVKLQKLSLNKSAIASLNGQQQGQAVGGATELGVTQPCALCRYTENPSCVNCPTVYLCPATERCQPTGRTVCFIC
ncbi:class I lanthipeptide [Taibaiella chishuiensis]|uniref:Uncharacterized protein n=1 Tax=Taibaiella chishuiensis TaxID=1434707 RepID=A0A2P8D444_9BACT|nr:class I lanthipeptide [Taibaiella chishuiensis]PSK91990.1 hypothetical protein B0I18_10484 [Taibaiella chishuiensis]